MAGWSTSKNAVDQTGDGQPATLASAVAAGDCLFAMTTNALSPAPTLSDNINGDWTLLGAHASGGTADRGGWLFCFLGSAAAGAGDLVITASAGDGATNILAWVHTPPTGTTGLTIGPTVPNGGSGTAVDPGSMTTTQIALLVAGMRMRPNSGNTITAGSGLTLVAGTGSGYLQAEYQVDAPAGTYHGQFVSSGALDGWTAIAAAIYATVPTFVPQDTPHDTMKIQQSTTAYPLVFKMVQEDHLTAATDLTITATLSKNGATFGAAAGAVTEIGNGYYKVAGNATDSNTLGKLVLHTEADGADDKDTEFEVVVENLTTAKVAAVGTVDNLTNAPTEGGLTAEMKTDVTTAATAATPVAASVTATVNADTKKINGKTITGSGTDLDPFSV
jgi:hypothetical protein